MQRKKLLWIGGGILLALIILGVVGIVVENQKYSGYDYDNGSVAMLSPQGMRSGLSFAEPAYEESAKMAETKIIPDASGGASLADRMIIKTGSLSLIVTDVRESARAIQTVATERGGFVVSSVVQGEEKDMSGTVTIRIPAKDFDTVLSSTKKLAKTVESESVNGQDVTEEFHDVEARLRNLRAEEEQFRTILKDAKKIEDILAVTREIQRVRQEIDYTEGRKKYLEQSAALSTITVYLATDAAALPVVEKREWRPLDVAKNALRGVVSTVRMLSNFIIRLVIFGIIWVPIAFIAWLVRRWWKRRHSVSIT